MNSIRIVTPVAVACTIAAGAALLMEQTADACPFCDAPQLTMAEMIDQSDHLLLAKWISGERPTSESAGSVNFQIVEVGRSQEDQIQAGEVITLPFYISGNVDQQFALMGPGTDYLNWQQPIEVTKDSWEYLRQCPAPEKDPERREERLAWFLQYMEHPELLVSNDAYGEFAAAPYKTIRPLRDQLPRENLKKWLKDSETPVTRIALYGMMLGLCGDVEDAPILEDIIMTVDTDFRLGLEGIMSGYVMITGEDGLQKLEDAKIHKTTYVDNEGVEQKLPFSETYATVNTLRFLKRYEPDCVPFERLAASMYLLLDRPELSDLIIADLARWQDWSVQDRLMKMFDEEPFQIPSIKRAIVRYMLACEKAGKKNPEEFAEYAASATTNLALLEDKDARIFRDAKRFFIR
jgi:hypothetical protein